MVSTAHPAAVPRARWQRLGEELELLTACFRLAGDPDVPNAPRRVRSLLETALLLRPLVTRFDEETVISRVERQLQLAKEWLAWHRQFLAERKSQGKSAPGTPEGLVERTTAEERLQKSPVGDGSLLDFLGEGTGASWLSRVFPLLILLAGQAKAGGSDRSGGQGSASPLSRLLQSLGPLLRSGLADGLSVLPSLLATLLKAGEANPSTAQTVVQTGAQTTAQTTAQTPAQNSAPALPEASQSETQAVHTVPGGLPSNITALLPQAEKLAADPEAVSNLVRRAEEKLGKDGLQRLQEMARRLAGEMEAEAAG